MTDIHSETTDTYYCKYCGSKIAERKDGVIESARNGATKLRCRNCADEFKALAEAKE